MSVDTKRVRGRRKLRFRSFDEALADAKSLRTSGYRALGNWNLGQVMEHLSRAMHGSIEGEPFQVGGWLRVLGPILLKPYMLNIAFPAGFRLPRRAEAKLVVEDADVDAAIRHFEQAVERLGRETHRIAHPVIGPLSVDQWNKFHLQHCAMHLSFLVPN